MIVVLGAVIMQKVVIIAVVVLAAMAIEVGSYQTINDKQIQFQLL